MRLRNTEKKKSSEKQNRLEQLILAKRQSFIRDNFLSDDFLRFFYGNREPFERMLVYYRCAMMEVETKFRVLNEQFSIRYDRNPIETIKTRIKSEESLIVKLRDKDLPLTIAAIEENIYDIAGVRVICSFPEDIYMLAESLLKQDDIKLIQRKDYIENPKPNGYRSLHLIVEVPIFLQNEKKMMKVEVQLRTIAMDFWASLEHKLRYKKNIPDSYVDELAGELLECANISADLDRRMQDIRTKITEIEKGERKVNGQVFPSRRRHTDK